MKTTPDLANAAPSPETVTAPSVKESILYGGFGLLLAITVFFPLQEKIEARLVRVVGELPRGLATSNVLLLLGIAALFLHPSETEQHDAKSRRISMALAGLAFFSVVSFFTAQANTGFNNFAADFVLWKRWTTTLLLYVFARRFIHNRAQVKALLHGMTAVLGFAALQLLRENFDAGMSSSHFKDNLRFAGIFSGSGINDAGAFFAEFIFLPLCLFAWEKGLFKRVYLAGVVALSALACVFTYSRGAWLAMVVGVVVYAFRRHPAAILVVVIAAVLIIPLLPPSVVNRWQMTQTEEGELESSAQSRVDLWESATSIILENPLLGVGMNRFRFLVKERLEPHNMYLKFATEQGIPALLCFLFFLAVTFLALQRPIDAFEREFFLAMSGCWAALVVVNIFGNRFLREGLISNYLILLGLLAWLRTHRPESPAADAEREVTA